MREIGKCLDFCANCGIGTLRVDAVSPPEELDPGEYERRFARLTEAWRAAAALLEEKNLRLGALCLALPWRGERETDAEKAEAGQALRFLDLFPEAALCLVQLPYEDRDELSLRQRRALACVNAVGPRAAERGIVSAFHPNSSAGSVFRTEDDYRVLFAGLDTRFVGYAPDTGHLANGGMEPLRVIRDNRSIVRHVHFKDIAADGRWTAMGAGTIDHPAIASYLAETGYDGWIMIGEESAEAEEHPDRVTIGNGRCAASHLRSN